DALGDEAADGPDLVLLLLLRVGELEVDAASRGFGFDRLGEARPPAALGADLREADRDGSLSRRGRAARFGTVLAACAHERRGRDCDDRCRSHRSSPPLIVLIRSTRAYIHPPSTMKLCAVHMRLSSEARNSTIAAMSSGSSRRFRHWLRSISCAAVSSTQSRSCRGVMTQPGT